MAAKSEIPEPSDLQAHLAALRAEVAALAKLVAETAEIRAKDALKGLAVAGAEPIGEAREKIESLAEDARTYTERKPLHALGIAAGVGVLFGLILGRR